MTLLLLLSHFSHVQLCATPETAAHQAPCPWDSPGNNTGVGCHFLLQCMKVKSESEVAQSCPTLSDPMDCSLPVALIKEWSDYWASLVAQMVKNLPAIQETWVRILGWEDPLAKGMATHSSILAWKTTWTEEPGGLQSKGLKESDTTEQLGTAQRSLMMYWLSVPM